VNWPKNPPSTRILVCPGQTSGTPAAIGFKPRIAVSPNMRWGSYAPIHGRNFIEPTRQSVLGVRLQLNVTGR